MPNCTYHVNFKIQKRTQFGDIIGVSGSSEELGEWKEFKYLMKWTKGDLWVSEKALITNKAYFCYKYVLLDSTLKMKDWERGLNRIADLELLSMNKNSIQPY